jgi:dihydrofolate synthase/folylpolyglutamate synthase
MIEESPWWQALHRFGMRPGLERTAALLDALGHPERRYPTVHVGGTNGKGSTVALIAAGLQAAGLKVGRYTSPDLGDLRERMTVGTSSELIPIAGLKTLMDRVEDAARGLAEPPTRFEALTGLAFLAFLDAGVDVAVVEVGLGGRYDATNVLERPLAVAFGPIALDHTAVLGPTLSLIARDKAGIIKSGVPVASVWQSPPARRELLDAARRMETGIHWARSQVVEVGRDYVTARVRGRVLRAGLAGPHQARNLALAATVLDLIGPRLGIDMHTARAGLAGVTWPARLEWLVPGDGPPVLLDAAHNLHGARALAAALSGPLYPRPRHLVFGVLADKPGRAMLRAMLPHVQSAALVRPESSRAGDPAAWAAGLGTTVPIGYPGSVAAAYTMAAARARADGQGAIVVVMGSFDVVGPVRRRIVPTGAASAGDR